LISGGSFFKTGYEVITDNNIGSDACDTTPSPYGCTKASFGGGKQGNPFVIRV
jgi:hypothetical protein